MTPPTPHPDRYDIETANRIRSMLCALALYTGVDYSEQHEYIEYIKQNIINMLDQLDPTELESVHDVIRALVAVPVSPEERELYARLSHKTWIGDEVTDTHQVVYVTDWAMHSGKQDLEQPF